jgi:DNA-binding NarL/FixJ family response regulator
LTGETGGEILVVRTRERRTEEGVMRGPVDEAIETATPKRWRDANPTMGSVHAGETRVVRVLIVAEVRLHREGMAAVLGRRPGVEVLATADPIDALEVARTSRPDVILVDVTMPSSSPAIRAISATLPHAKLLALGVVESRYEAVAHAEAGITACVSREASADHLVDTIHRAACDELVPPSAIGTALAQRAATVLGQDPEEPEGRLTLRELEIVALIDQGLSNKEIARRLCIELATVKNHVHHILEKLRVHRRGEAAARIRARRSSEHRIRTQLGSKPRPKMNPSVH